MLETELKAILTEKQYNQIKGMFSWNSAVEQTNSYYIAPDNILKKHGITFRIRTIDNAHTIQIKKHRDKRGALQIAEETEFDVDCIPEKFTEDEVYAYTGIKAEASLIGELTTLRHSYLFCDGVEICLDKSVYLCCTDYEIEIEYTTPIPDELLKKLTDNGIDFDQPTPGKFSRFITRLKNTYLR